MEPTQATWEQQLSDIKHVMQAARAQMNDPRAKRGRKRRGKIAPPPADTTPDLRSEEREYEEAERRARREQADVFRNPYGDSFHPVDR
jgi:hypothetical protein